jgi:glycerophosphoryl diester phosphodiesterase
MPPYKPISRVNSNNGIRIPYKLLAHDWMKRVWDAGLGIVCWHEERPSEIEALWNLGVDAICSDMPELLVRSVYPQ